MSRPTETSDYYRTLAGSCEFRQKIDRSDFLAIGFPIENEESFHDEVRRIEKKHFDATHRCWAFRLRTRSRSSDAGEPSGTAGKPILAAIDGAELQDVAVVVVRWYGGVKLGTGGLSRAYRETAAGALRQGTIVDRYLYSSFRVVVPFDSMSAVYRLVDPPNVVLAEKSFGESNEFLFEVRQSKAEVFAKTLAELRLEFSN